MAAIKAIVVERRRDLNLRKLHSITVGFGLDAMLRAHYASLQVSSALQRSRSNRNRVGAAGCVAGVMRDGRYLSQVFLDATHLVDLVDDPQKESYAANIVAHELAHVALNHWQTQPTWDYVSPTLRRDWRYEALSYCTLHFWDEYAACRLSARFGDPKLVARNFIECLFHHTVQLPRLRLHNRKHWQTRRAAKTFLKAVSSAAEPLRSASYIMGHIDGLAVPVNVLDLCPTVRTTPLATCWPGLHQELQRLWQQFDPDFDFALLDGLAKVLMDATRICGGERMLAGMPLT
ncbi:hypothetical protein ACFONN_10365 [Dyella humi]|uniref:Peptidase M48 domain-containing protein n=1 Tax=Dyella humi TaxID=1770547 RepID=A0ABW8IJP1_9GAMM